MSLPEARQIDILGRQIAALAPRLRGLAIAHAVHLLRTRLDAGRAPARRREDVLRSFIRGIRRSIERHTQGAQIGPSAGT